MTARYTEQRSAEELQHYRSVAQRETAGVHTSFRVFIRLAYVWAIVATAVGIWAALSSNPHGIACASRHTLTVRSFAMMIFGVVVTFSRPAPAGEVVTRGYHS